MGKASALTKFLKKHGKTIDDFKEGASDAGKTALGAGKMAAEKTADYVKKNPGTTGLAGGIVAGAELRSAGDRLREKKKKKKPDYLDD